MVGKLGPPLSGTQSETHNLTSHLNMQSVQWFVKTVAGLVLASNLFL